MSDDASGSCRYFLTGGCTRGDSCKYKHDQSSSRDICRFYVMGSCNYGTACRFLHQKPDKKTKEKPTASATRPSMKMPGPVKLAPPGLNVEAPAFVPSWLAKEPLSYACAAGSQPSESVESSRTIPLCPYFSETGECSQADCMFVHGLRCDMCNLWCLYPDDEEQQKQHFEECSLEHEFMMNQAFVVAKSQGKTCGICMETVYEKNLRFGILENCRHCFCLNCIREWRNAAEFKNEVVRSCPECRVLSYYVIPSVIWLETEEEKKVLLDSFKENTKQKQCKYYKKGATMEECPFGNKCFYLHQLPDGTIDEGQEPHERRRPRLADFLFNDIELDTMLSNYDEWENVLETIARIERN